MWQLGIFNSSISTSFHLCFRGIGRRLQILSNLYTVKLFMLIEQCISKPLQDGNICMNLEPLMDFNEPIVLFCYLKFADYAAYLSAPINNPFCFLIHCCPSQQFSTTLMLLLVATFSHVIRLRDWLCS